MKVFWFYDKDVEVISVDRTPEWENTYAFVYELWRMPEGNVYYAAWHGGARSGGWDAWEIPPEIWPEDEEKAEAAIEAAAALVNSGRARKVRDCPYCDGLLRR
jgi:hypothetical protein